MTQSITTVSGSTLTVAGTEIHVTGVEHVGPETQTEPCDVPRLSWSATDSNGHEHRWWLPANPGKGRRAKDPQTPTLVKSLREMDCDGTCGNWDCDGYRIEEWHCIVCGDQVEPGFERGTVTFETSSAYVRITSEGPMDDPSSDLLRAEPGTLRYPAGPGRMAVIDGHVWETYDRTVVYRGGTRTVHRSFDLRPA